MQQVPKFIKIHEEGTNRLIALVAYRTTEEGNIETAAAFLKRKDPYDFKIGSELATERLNSKSECYSCFSVSDALNCVSHATHLDIGAIIKERQMSADMLNFPAKKLAIIEHGVAPFDLSRPKGYKI